MHYFYKLLLCITLSVYLNDVMSHIFFNLWFKWGQRSTFFGENRPYRLEEDNFDNSVTFLTSVTRSKVMPSSNSYHRGGQGQWCLWPSLVERNGKKPKQIGDLWSPSGNYQHSPYLVLWRHEDTHPYKQKIFFLYKSQWLDEG